MPRRPDVPCARCGRLIWRGTGSLQPGKAICQPCRRAAQPDRWERTPIPCADCSTPIIPRTRQTKFCPECRAARQRARRNAPRPRHAPAAPGQPLNPRGGRPRTRLVNLVHERDTHCHLCRLPLIKELRGTNHPLAPTVDELVPIIRDGDPLDPDNCRAACRCCNTSRGPKPLTPEVYARCRTLSLSHRQKLAPTRGGG